VNHALALPLSAVGKGNFVTTPLPSLPFGWHGPSKTLPSHLLNMVGANDWPTLLLLSSWLLQKARTPFSQTGCADSLFSQQILLLFFKR